MVARSVKERLQCTALQVLVYNGSTREDEKSGEKEREKWKGEGGVR